MLAVAAPGGRRGARRSATNTTQHRDEQPLQPTTRARRDTTPHTARRRGSPRFARAESRARSGRRRCRRPPPRHRGSCRTERSTIGQERGQASAHGVVPRVGFTSVQPFSVVVGASGVAGTSPVIATGCRWTARAAPARAPGARCRDPRRRRRAARTRSARPRSARSATRGPLPPAGRARSGSARGARGTPRP